jgi:hypothetical protein
MDDGNVRFIAACESDGSLNHKFKDTGAAKYSRLWREVSPESATFVDWGPCTAQVDQPAEPLWVLKRESQIHSPVLPWVDASFAGHENVEVCPSSLCALLSLRLKKGREAPALETVANAGSTHPLVTAALGRKPKSRGRKD